VANARIQVPASLSQGEVFEVRVLIRHPMETGLRHNDIGQLIPQNVIHLLTCRYNGVEVFRAELFPGVAANPYVSFFTTAVASGELEVSWTDDGGQTGTERASVMVLPRS